jgi:chromosome segregation ATPase
MYMKVKNHDWARAIEAYLGKTFKNFLVESYDDRDKLFGILEKHNCGCVPLYFLKRWRSSPADHA